MLSIRFFTSKMFVYRSKARIYTRNVAELKVDRIFCVKISVAKSVGYSVLNLNAVPHM
jgi:hypothetical protein